MKKIFLFSLLLCLTACASGDIKNHKLPYWNKLGERDTADLNMIVIHATELTDIDEAREYGERVLYESGTGASGHYYIDRDGTYGTICPR